MASHLFRLSRDAMAEGVLDELGEEIFTTAKVRKALDRLFVEQDDSFVRLVRRTLGDGGISPSQIRAAFSRIWRTETPASTGTSDSTPRTARDRKASARKNKPDYGEAHHTDGKPAEVVELYRALDRFCQDLAPGRIARRHLAKHIAWSIGKDTFCSVHILQSGLKVWLKISPRSIPASITFARDVSKVGHWGVGDVEVICDGGQRLSEAEQLIRMAYQAAADREL